jgi:hypothetical protein
MRDQSGSDREMSKAFASILSFWKAREHNEAVLSPPVSVPR